MRTSEGNRDLLAYKWVVLINTTIGVLMSALDSSITTIALPNITRSLHASVPESMWILMGYQLVITALLLPFSRVADMKGRVRSYNLGFAVFTGASVLCGLAQTGTQLVIFRLLQGIGAALLFANSTALITDAFPTAQRGFALSINMVAANSGFILGTVLGGILTEFFGWRYVFFINLPFGIFATAWAYVKLHEIVAPERAARFDLGGMLAFPLAMASLLVGLTLVVMGRAGQALTNGLVVAGVVLFVLFLGIERRVSSPMMDLTLFRIRVFWAGNASLCLNALSRGATMFIMSWYFQAVLGDSPLLSGLKTLPMVVTMLGISPVAGFLSDRLGSRWLSTLGLGCTLAAQAWIVTFPVDIPYGLLAAALAVLGIGNGLFNAPNTRAVMGSVPPNRRGVASGVRTLLNNSGRTVAIAVSMVFLSTTMSYGLLTELFTGAGTGSSALDTLAFMAGFHEIFLFGAVVSALAIVCSSLRGAEGVAPASGRVATLEPS
jgi:EmrB/QacA subfamily drug resistance transporter